MNEHLQDKPPVVIYLHGLASSPQSAKAEFFRQQFENVDWTFLAPDLNLPDFTSVTLSRGIADVVRELAKLEPKRRVVLMGSSFGALTALHAYDQLRDNSQIVGLILLAPAFDFQKNKEMSLKDFEKWKSAREAVICHNNLPLSFMIVEDAARYDSYAVPIEIPCLVIHGRHDASIGVEQSELFKERNPNAELMVFDDEHQLLRSVAQMWDQSPADGSQRGVVPDFIARKICPL